MFDSVLVANRGEIAVRIARTLAALGVESVAVFSDADAGAPHTLAADRAIRIEGETPRAAYLSSERIVDAAVRAGVDAIHPGYGFLSENPDFARACAAAGIVFVGPSADTIAAMGDKAQARALAAASGVPVLPGTTGDDPSDAEIVAFCRTNGLPVLLKAVAGGGGKGMRMVRTPDDLGPALDGARREARAAFGDGRVFAERLLEHPRHIEVQVLADGHGSVVHLGERDCSLQRRHQKIIEESPAPGLEPAVRRRLGESAVALTTGCGYLGAGTIEFLVSPEDDGFFFLEMNTRLQVEHPVTEAVTGLDLVELQLRIAAGEPLPFTQEEIVSTGHAIEARLYAEDAAAGFLPAAGRLVAWEPPELEGIRIDSGVGEGSVVTTDFDPLLAKVVAHGRTREVARRRLREALGPGGLLALGVRTNQDFLHRLLDQEEVRMGKPDTELVERIAHEATESTTSGTCAIAAALVLQEEARQRHAAASTVPFGWSLSGSASNFRVSLGDSAGVRYALALDGDRATVTSAAAVESRRARLVAFGSRHFTVEVDAVTYPCAWARDEAALWVSCAGSICAFSVAGAGRTSLEASNDALVAPMPGMVVAVEARNGQRVETGEVLLVLESMKMELPVAAPHNGIVAALDLAAGDRVVLGQILATVHAEEATT
ncbi:MAG: biotin carboxylase N-terminal domain-containing protein [Gaiella sp.]